MKIVKKINEKNGISNGFDVRVHYFEVELLGGKSVPNDSDDLIYNVEWKSMMILILNNKSILLSRYVTLVAMVGAHIATIPFSVIE